MSCFLLVVHADLKRGSALLHVKNNLPRKIINAFLILSLWAYSIGKGCAKPCDRYPKQLEVQSKGGRSA